MNIVDLAFKLAIVLIAFAFTAMVGRIVFHEWKSGRARRKIRKQASVSPAKKSQGTKTDGRRSGWKRLGIVLLIVLVLAVLGYVGWVYWTWSFWGGKHPVVHGVRVVPKLMVLVVIGLVVYALWTWGREKYKGAGDEKKADKTAPRPVSVMAVLFTVEQFYYAVLYWRFFGRRGRIVDVYGPGLKAKLPGFMDVALIPAFRTTSELKSEDKIPTGGLPLLQGEEEDFLSKELTSMGAMPMPHLKPRPLQRLTVNALVTFTWQVTYQIVDARKFIELEPAFRNDPLKYIEAVVTGRLYQAVPSIFFDDTFHLDGDIVMLGDVHEIIGVTTKEDIAKVKTVYTTSEGRAHWVNVREAAKFTDGSPRFRFDLKDNEIKELERTVPDCPFLRILDKGIRVIEFARQRTVPDRAVQDLIDKQTTVEQERRIARTAQGQLIDQTRAEIIARNMQSSASSHNFVTEVADTAKNLRKQMDLGEPIPLEKMFDMIIKREFLRVMRLAPEGKYILASTEGLLPALGKYMGITPPSK